MYLLHKVLVKYIWIKLHPTTQVRYSDVEGRFPQDKEWKQEKKKSTKCRLVFRTAVQNLLGESETLQVHKPFLILGISNTGVRGSLKIPPKV